MEQVVLLWLVVVELVVELLVLMLCCYLLPGVSPESLSTNLTNILSSTMSSFRLNVRELTHRPSTHYKCAHTDPCRHWPFWDGPSYVGRNGITDYDSVGCNGGVVRSGNGIDGDGEIRTCTLYGFFLVYLCYIILHVHCQYIMPTSYTKDSYTGL